MYLLIYREYCQKNPMYKFEIVITPTTAGWNAKKQMDFCGLYYLSLFMCFYIGTECNRLKNFNFCRTLFMIILQYD